MTKKITLTLAIMSDAFLDIMAQGGSKDYLTLYTEAKDAAEDMLSIAGIKYMHAIVRNASYPETHQAWMIDKKDFNLLRLTYGNMYMKVNV